MTAPRSTSRGRRRAAGATEIPKNIAQWFAGERRFTFFALVHPWAPLLPEYWEAWKQEHPDARPPVGYERLDAPQGPLSEHQQQVLDSARAATRRRPML